MEGGPVLTEAITVSPAVLLEKLLCAFAKAIKDTASYAATWSERRVDVVNVGSKVISISRRNNPPEDE